MKIGFVITETWAFFQEIYDLFSETHQVSQFNQPTIKFPVFQGRINRLAVQKSIDQFCDQNQVVFFEWASESLALFSHRPKKCGIVARLHRYELYQWANQINWDHVDHLIVVSQAKEKEILDKFPQLQGKVSVITEAVNLEHFQFSPHPFNKQLGILCHLSPRKRVYELILAFAESGLAAHGYKLHIGGGLHPKFGDYYLAIKQVVSKLDLDEDIIFYEHVKDAKAWYENIDIFISNSYSEGLQVSPMEAMSSGIYCLSHDWDGADELLPQENLFLTNQQLIQKIIHYQTLSPAEQLRKREQLRERIETNFDIKHTSKKILSLVEAIGEKYS